MPTCVICGGKFAPQSWSAPAEPCDCGAEVTADEALRRQLARFRDIQRRCLHASDIAALRSLNTPEAV